MASKGFLTLLGKQLKARVKPGLLYFFAILLLLNFSGQFVAFGQTPAQSSYLPQDFSRLHSPSFSKHSLPFESMPAQGERETPDENEQEDDYDYDCKLTLEEQALFSLFDLAFIRNWITPVSSFIENRSPVPFFVLYHSWKTYLS